jgi:hypothetical protein
MKQPYTVSRQVGWTTRVEAFSFTGAAEARGITKAEPKSRKPTADRKESASRRAAGATPARTRIVWAVCDIGGRTVTTFDFSKKVDAEALIVHLKAKGKGEHFIRSLKEPMD